MHESFIDTYIRRFIHERYMAYADEILPIPVPTKPPGDSVRELHNQQVPLRFLVAETVEPIRIEPENPYTLHTTVPSVRGRMSNRLILVDAGKAWRYCPVTAGWHEEVDPCPGPERVGRTLLLVQSDFLVLGPIYGEFAITLALLDAGHLVQGVREVVQELGYDVQVTYLPGSRQDNEFRCLLLAEIDLTSLRRQGVPLMANADSPCPAPHSISGSDMTNRWNLGPEARILVESISGGGQHNFAISTPPASGRSWARRYRGSGHTAQGLTFISKPVPEMLLADLVRTAQWWEGDEAVSVVVVLREGDDYSVLDLDAAGVRKRGKWPLAPSALLRHPGDGLAFEDMILTALIMVDVVALRSQRTAAVAASIIRTGEVAQALSVAAAGAGLCARPLKDIDERLIMETLEESRVPMHMIVAGYPAATSLAVAVREEGC